MPCARSVPSQHFDEYVLSLHKQPLLPPLGLDLPCVSFTFFLRIVRVYVKF
tara:strand:+ start:354 stop:506 length:153 start_codon:yes stop_codon:yes gene_type:complete